LAWRAFSHCRKQNATRAMHPSLIPWRGPETPPTAMIRTRDQQHPFPDWLRWSALAFLAVWAAVYWRTWGAVNFLHLCDVAVILTCLGLWSGSALLISSQAVGSLVVDTAWTIDVAWKILFGHPLLSGTEYLFDARYPLWARLITLFHVAMPPLLLWALRRSGYDRGGYALQSVIALAAFVASRCAASALNINYAFADPFGRVWGPAPVQVTVIFLFMALVVYLPTHILLRWWFPVRGESSV
jgi:hypothetical protein